MSSIVGAKAIGLVQDGRVREDSFGRVFPVEGSGGRRYRVTLAGGEWACDCPAGQARRECYHVQGAKLLLARQRREGAEPGRLQEWRVATTFAAPSTIGTMHQDVRSLQEAREWAALERADYPHASVVIERRRVEPWEVVE